MSRGPALVISAEHASRAVPRAYRALFAGADDLLASHRGSDWGTEVLGRHLAHAFGVPLHAADATRLLIDCNRSAAHPRLFSEFTRGLDPDERDALVREHYAPLRTAVAQAVAVLLERGSEVLHLSVHSFTPVMGGQVRDADIGLLYDPARAAERELCVRWQALLRGDGLRVRRNYPYRGVSDGHVTALRRRFAGQRYLGVELEINQAIVAGELALWRRVQRNCASSLALLLGDR